MRNIPLEGAGALTTMPKQTPPNQTLLASEASELLSRSGIQLAAGKRRHEKKADRNSTSRIDEQPGRIIGSGGWRLLNAIVKVCVIDRFANSELQHDVGGWCSEFAFVLLHGARTGGGGWERRCLVDRRVPEKR